MHTIQQEHLLYPSLYIIAVASPGHHSRLQALGTDSCFDYKSPTIENDVDALGKNMTRAIDCFSEGPTTVACERLMRYTRGKASEGRIIRTPLPPGMIQGKLPQGTRADEWILSYTALGKVSHWVFSPSPLLATHLLDVHPISSRTLKPCPAPLTCPIQNQINHL